MYNKPVYEIKYYHPTQRFSQRALNFPDSPIRGLEAVAVEARNIRIAYVRERQELTEAMDILRNAMSVYKNI